MLHTDHWTNKTKANDTGYVVIFPVRFQYNVQTNLDTSELVRGVGEHEVAQAQRANLFHLADGARSLHRTVVAEALKQLAHYVPFGVQSRAYDKREAKALLVLRVEGAQARDLRRLQVREAGRALLVLRVPG